MPNETAAVDAGPTDDADRYSFVLIGTRDIVGSVGRSGFLARRLRASKPDAPEPQVTITAGLRSDVVAQQLATGPETVAMPMPAGLNGWLDSMFAGVRVDDTTALLALSVSAALDEEVWRHRETGLLVQPPSDRSSLWNREQLSWLESEFEPLQASPERISASLVTIANLTQQVGADLLLLNVSTYSPSEKVYYYKPGEEHTHALKAQALNLLVEKLAGEHGFFLLDVDRIIAELGAGAAVLSPGNYSDDALGVIADEATSTIMALPSVILSYGADVMQLAVPRYDRRTEAGVLEEWHVTAPAAIEPGEALFDVRFDDLHTRLAGQGKRATGRSLRVSVVSTQSGYLKEITMRAGSNVEVGSRVGVVVKEQHIDPGDVDNAAGFPVGVRLSSE